MQTEIRLSRLERGNLEAALKDVEPSFQGENLWYQVLEGAVAENADVRVIQLGKERKTAGFVEVFEWDGVLTVDTLYVLPQFRWQGIGSAVVHLLEEEGRLNIMATPNTFQFYERFEYFPDPDQGGYVMVKRLPPENRYARFAGGAGGFDDYVEYMST